MLTFHPDSNTSIPLIKCQKSTGEDWYCCPGDPNCDCDTGKYAVKLGAQQPTTVTVIGSTSWPGFSKTSSGVTIAPLVTAGTSTDLSAGANTGSATATGTSSLSSFGSTSGASSTGSTPNQTSAPTTTPRHHSNVALAAGLGAGLGAATLLIAFLIFLLVRRRRKLQSISGPVQPGLEVIGPEMTAPKSGLSYASRNEKIEHSELAGNNEYRRPEMEGNSRPYDGVPVQSISDENPGGKA